MALGIEDLRRVAEGIGIFGVSQSRVAASKAALAVAILQVVEGAP